MFLTKSIPVRTADELAAMRRAGRVVAEMHERIREAIRPGVSTGDLDRIGREVLDRRGATSNFLGYHGYPAVICASPNDMVVHGIPSDAIVLEDGRHRVDRLRRHRRRLARRRRLHRAGGHRGAPGARAHRGGRRRRSPPRSTRWSTGGRLGDIGAAVQGVVEGAGFAVVRDYTGPRHRPGHARGPGGPQHRPARHRRPRLRSGNVLAIEPMVSAGTDETVVLDDGWSVLTADGAWAAHTEHTVAVTDDGPEILTRPELSAPASLELRRSARSRLAACATPVADVRIRV